VEGKKRGNQATKKIAISSSNPIRQAMSWRGGVLPEFKGLCLLNFRLRRGSARNRCLSSNISFPIIKRNSRS